MYRILRLRRLAAALCLCALLAALWAGYAVFPKKALCCQGDIFTVSTLPADGEPSGEHTVCLTFDDGPTALTESVLDTLARLNAPGTFFVVTGENEKYLPLLVRMTQEGHCVALHGQSHNYRKIYAGTQAFFDDLQAASDGVYAACGLRPVLFRFPGGSSNSVCRKYGGQGLMASLISQSAALGYTYVDWNVSAEDATGARYTAQEIARRVISGCRGRRKSVVLMHDTAKNAATRDALPIIVETLRDEGYTFVTADMLHAPVQHIKPDKGDHV